MKYARLILLSLALIANSGFAQWVQTDGPYGRPDVMTVFGKGPTDYATVYLSGFFYRPVGENSWKLADDQYFRSFAIKGDSLFADAHYLKGGISRDAGIVRYDLNNPEAEPVTVYTQVIAQALVCNDTCLLGGSERDGFFTLGFDGQDLRYFNTGLPTDTMVLPWGTFYRTNVTALRCFGDLVFCGTDKGVYRKGPGTGPWQAMNQGVTTGKVAFIELSDDTLYAAVAAGLYRCPAAGSTWELLFTAPSAITSFLKQEGRMWAGTAQHGVWHSAGYGLPWAAMNPGLTDLSVNCLAFADSGLTCGTRTKGIFSFREGNWTPDGPGMISSLTWSMTVAGETLMAGDEEDVYRLEPGGNWTVVSPQVRYELFSSLAATGDTAFLSVELDTIYWPYDIPFILYTTDKGTTWNPLMNPVPFAGDDPYWLYCDHGKLYALENGLMSMTDDLGLHWTDMRLPSWIYCGFNGFVVYRNQPFAAAGNHGKVVKWVPGSGWTLSNTGLPPDRDPLGLAMCDSALFVFVNAEGMYVSFDQGNSWSFAGEGLNTQWGFRDYASDGNRLFVTTENGVFVTGDFGQSWHACNEGLQNLNIASMELMNDTLYVGTYGNGVWKRALSGIHQGIGDHPSGGLPCRVYPNPASDRFSVKTSVPGPCTLQVVDLAGGVLLDGTVRPGESTDLHDLKNGLYLVRLKTAGGLSVHKLQVVR